MLEGPAKRSPEVQLRTGEVFDVKHNPPHLLQKYIEIYSNEPDQLTEDQKTHIRRHLEICEKCKSKVPQQLF